MLSALLHAGAAAALLLPLARTGGPAVQAPPIEVELMQVSMAGGAAPAEPTPAPAAADAQSADAPGERPDAPEAGAAPQGPTAPDAPDAPSQPAARQAAAQAPPPAVNLGDGGAAPDSLDARSDDVVPPRPDSRFRNLPPAYPPDAGRRREEGTVRLVVRVSTEGVPVQVEVAGSSGHPSLDQAAVRAVARWHFNPAQGMTGPVPFDYSLSINFIGSGR